MNPAKLLILNNNFGKRAGKGMPFPVTKLLFLNAFLREGTIYIYGTLKGVPLTH
jgi:hypothetical protein